MQPTNESDNKAAGAREIRKHEDIETSFLVAYALVHLRFLAA